MPADQIQSTIENWVQHGVQWVMDEHPEWVFNIYPPYIGAGVTVTHVSDDFRHVEVEMPLRWWNQNYVGTHFGGSLYAMCDPFLMVMVLQNLGSAYVVWDKSAQIDFRRPGRGTVRAHFHVTDDRLEQIRDEVATDGVSEPVFDIEIKGPTNEVVAHVEKQLHVRREEQ